MIALQEAKNRLRMEVERRNQQIQLPPFEADELRDAIDLVLQRVNRLESVIAILKHLEGVS